MNAFIWIFGYVIFLNIYLYWMMGKDKEFAKKGMGRVPEKHFFLFSALGGAVGAYMGMKYHRHKTKHKSFTVGIPVIIAIHIIIIIVLLGVYL